MVWLIATKFGMVTQFGTYDASHSQNLVISKFQPGGCRQFEKSKNRHTSATVSTKFGTVMQFGPRDRLVGFKFEI